MKNLFTVTAILEVPFGLVLGLWPAVPVHVMLGTSLDTSGAVVLARLAGVAILALGFACWLARGHASQDVGSVLIPALVVYNLAALAVLVYAFMGVQLFGIGIWPAIVLHGVMAGWCIKIFPK